LRIQGLVFEQELTKNKLKENLLKKITPPFNSSQNTQNKSRNAAITKSTSDNGKSKPTIMEVADKVTPLDTLVMPFMIDYNIVEDMNKTQANISIFELTRTTS